MTLDFCCRGFGDLKAADSKKKKKNNPNKLKRKPVNLTVFQVLCANSKHRTFKIVPDERRGDEHSFYNPS